MAAALSRIYVVCKGEYVFVIIVVILKRSLHGGYLLLFGPVAACRYVYGLVVQHGLFPVQVLHKADYAAFIAEGAGIRSFGPFVRNGYPYSGVKEGKLPHSVRQYIKVIVYLVKYLVIGEEGYAGAAHVLRNVLYGLNRRLRLAIGIFLIIQLAVAPHLRYEPF